MGTHVIALAGLILALGGKPEEADDILSILSPQIMPSLPSETIELVQEAIIEVRMAD